MEAITFQKYLRFSPRKLAKLASPLSNMSVEGALEMMRQLPSPRTRFLEKAIKSAFANLRVKKEGELNESEAFIKSIVVEQSYRLKRLKPRARGRADIIQRRFSHLKCVVTDEPGYVD